MSGAVVSPPSESGAGSQWCTAGMHSCRWNTARFDPSLLSSIFSRCFAVWRIRWLFVVTSLRADLCLGGEGLSCMETSHVMLVNISSTPKMKR